MFMYLIIFIILSYNVQDETISLRLIGDATKEAIVEVSNGFTWGRICTDSWSQIHADIVCKQFGYNRGLAALSVPFEDIIDEQKEVFLNPSDMCSVWELDQTGIGLCYMKAVKEDCECRRDNAGVICRECYTFSYNWHIHVTEGNVS